MSKKIIVNIITYLILILFAIFMLFPFYWMIVSSLKTSQEIVSRPPTWFPEDLTLDNYREVFLSVPIGRYIMNSMIVAVLSVVTTLYTTITGAFVLSKSSLPGKHIILGMLIGLMMVPYELLIVTNYKTIVNLNINNNLVALFLPFMSSIFYTLLLKNHFDRLPQSLYHSVLVDGGSDWKYLWKILVPTSKPVIISIVLFNFIASWNSFTWPLLIVKSQDNRTITFGIYAFISEGGEHFELMMALSVIVILPMILVFLIMRKYLIKGISFDGSKG